MKPNFLAIVFLGYTLLVSPSLFANSQLEEAQSLLQASKPEQALALTNEFLEQNPGNIEARFMKGLILTRTEQLQEAEIVFDELTRDHPDLPEPYNNLAVVYAAQGKFEEAKDALSRAINTHPSYATAHENLGDIYAKMASRAYNQALELDYDNTSAREKLSLIKNLFSTQSTKPSEPKPAEPTQVAVVAEPKSEEIQTSLQPKPVTTPVPTVETKPVEEPVVATVTENETVEVIPSAPLPAPGIEVDPGVEASLLDWAVAWSSQVVEDYLDFYSSEFVPPQSLTRSVWQQQRRVRLSKPKFINIELSSIDVIMTGVDSATVTFKQSYTSDTYQDSVKKRLRLHKQNNQWKILEETSI